VRGEVQWFTSDNGLSVYKWKDNSSVHLLSNFSNPDDSTEVSRKQKNGTRIQVSRPQALVDYNSNMNYVDKFDQLLSSCKINRRSKKWWHRIFFYLLDACAVNAYCIYKMLPTNLPLMSAKDFRMEVIQGLISPTVVSRKRKSFQNHDQVAIKKHKSHVSSAVRLDSSSHQPVRSTRRRCASCSTKVKDIRTNWACSVCNVENEDMLLKLSFLSSFPVL
jgi:hypothetical protein